LRAEGREPDDTFLAAWYASHRRELDGLGYDDYRLMVLEGLDRVRTPLGSGGLAKALAEVDRRPAPPCAGRYASPHIRRIVGLCAVLHEHADAFPLAANALADELDAEPGTVSRWLRLLVRDGVLIIVTRSRRGRATEYHYAGGDDQHDVRDRGLDLAADEAGPYEERY
jgi:hypothetical protein